MLPDESADRIAPHPRKPSFGWRHGACLVLGLLAATLPLRNDSQASEQAGFVFESVFDAANRSASPTRPADIDAALRLATSAWCH